MTGAVELRPYQCEAVQASVNALRDSRGALESPGRAV